LIKLNQECRAYAEHIGAGKIKIEKFKRKLDTHKINNVHEMAHSLDEVEHMIDEEILRQSGVEVQTNTSSYLIYKCNLTTMGAIRRRQFPTNNDTASKDRHIVYVKSPKVEINIRKKETHKFVIMDFEFSMINKTSMVVIFGAISNSLDRFKIRKLEGRPLLLPLNEKARPMGEMELLVAVKEIKRVFRIKTDIRDACLDQLKQSLSSNRNNLTKGYIESYIKRGNKENTNTQFK
ncbi:Uncharacterized protein FWK35_00031140, partial [Aphis craccivora]